MSVVLDQFTFDGHSIEQDIQLHPAWIGHVSGLHADKLLRGCKTPYRFILRKGECEGAYYVSYIQSDGTIKHQPFVLSIEAEGWYYENSGTGGPFIEATIDDVIHLIMHCHKNECTPLNV